MIVLLVGAPGAGKGTQADLLSSQLGFRKVSTGDALRKHVSRKTEIGKVAEQVMARGELVSDDILLEILRQEVGVDSSERILLDGYPRNVNQAKSLDSLSEAHLVARCVHLDVPEDELVARLSGRRICGQCGASYHLDFAPPKNANQCDKCGSTALLHRPDDQPGSIAKRLQVFKKDTAPVLEFYKGKGIYNIVDGRGKQDEIFEEITVLILKNH